MKQSYADIQRVNILKVLQSVSKVFPNKREISQREIKVANGAKII